MIELKNFSGKLNLDDSYYVLPPNDYPDALNITHDAIEGSNDTIITSVVGNRQVVNPYIVNTYYNSNYNFRASVLINDNGTQTVVFTFDTLPSPPTVTALTVSYFNGTSWVNDTGSTESPRQITIPQGTYQYRVGLEPSNTIYELAEVSDANVTIGAYPNLLRNSIVFFNWSEAGYHSVLEYNNTTRTITKIFLNLVDSDTDVLGFTKNGKITSINIFNRDEGDLLFFIDSLDRPTYMNITLMKADTYNPVTRDILDVGKMPPLEPPAAVYGDDATRSVNYLRNKFFRFKYRWVYDDDFKSTTGPISQVEIPVEILYEPTTSDPTKNNIITLSMKSGGKDVKAIEVLMSYVEKTNDWSDFQLVDTVNKEDESIGDDEVFSYDFTNDSTYPIIDINESLLLFDYVPQKAKCQELLNGNVLGYGAITEGYDKDITPNVNNNVSTYEIEAPATGSLTAVQNLILGPDAFNRYFYRIDFSGIPAVGTIINIKVTPNPSGSPITAATYTTIAGDNVTSVNNALQASVNSGVLNPTALGSYTKVTIQVDADDYNVPATVEIISPTTSLSRNSTPVWKWSTERNIGIAYFDKKGVTNGLLYNGKITFPAYADSITEAVLLPQIETAIYHRPPSWAHSYQFYFTREETQYLFWVTNSVNFSENDYIYFEVTGLTVNATKFPTTTNVLSYSFQDGDRVRLIKPVGQDTFYTDDYDAAVLGLVTDPKINGTTVTGQFIKVKKSTPFENATFSPYYINYVIEIYRPKQQTANDENRTYFECGQQYAILDPETTDRRHAGMLQDQSADLVTPATFQFREGDAYFRQRTIALTDSGTSTGYSTFNVVDRNIVDTFISAVNSLEGRANLIDINAKNAYYGAMIRFGQAYQPNTNINGLNRFFPDNFQDVDYSYGSIRRLKTRDRFVRVFQEYKTGNIPLFSQINKQPNGDVVTVVTDKLLNPVQYYVGDWGIGTCPESLASFNFADYFCDNTRGAICRVSNDGVTPLSIVYKLNSWANTNLPLRKNTYKIYGAFEQRQNNYVMALEAVGTSEAQTLTYDEERNSFDSFVSYKPEMMCSLGVLFVTFKNGQLWTHDDEPNYNNFYGVQYNSKIKGVFNANVYVKKTYLSVSQVASQIWRCPDIETTVNSYGKVKQRSELKAVDFATYEDNFYASFLRDSNSIGGIINGSTLKGNYIAIDFEADLAEPPENNLVTLSVVSVKYNESPLNNR